MSSLAGSWAACGLLVCGVVSYWLYRGAGVSVLAPWLGTFRRVVMLSSAALQAPLLAHAGVDALLPVTLGLGAFLYALNRQWLLMDACPQLVPGEERLLSSDDLAVVLPDGSAVPLALLARLRMARVGEDTLVHCGMSGSLALFESAGDLRPELPHPTGFSVAGPGGLWDGVDGSVLMGRAPLRRGSLTLSDGAAWRRSHPDASLHVLAGQRDPIVPAVPSPGGADSRAVEDPMRLGAVRHGGWSSAIEGPADLFLARWSARVRGLAGTEDSP